MSTAVVPISLSHVPTFRAALDTVAKEKKYLAMVEAPPLMLGVRRPELLLREEGLCAMIGA